MKRSPSSVFVFVSLLLLTRAAPVCAQAQDKDGVTPLMQAARGGILEQVKTLLEAGAAPNAKDKDGATPLMWASTWSTYDVIMSGKEERHAEIVKLLLSRGAKINAREKNGMTALLVAVAWDHPIIARALIESGADVNAQDKLGRTAVTFAAWRGANDRYLAGALLQKGARIRLIDALLLRDIPAARKLVNRADIGALGPDKETPLMLAAREGDFEIIETLLKKKANVNAQDEKGRTALMYATGGQQYISRPSGHRYWEPSGVREGREKIVQALLDKGAKVDLQDEQKQTALHWSVGLKQEGVTRILLARGADPSLPDEVGYTALDTAVRDKEPALIKILLSAKADRNAKPADYAKALSIAVGDHNTSLEIVRLLLENGADIRKPLYGRTPLMTAAHNGTAEVVKLLIEKGAKINETDNEGMTPLMFASGWNTPDVIEILLAHGANVHQQNLAGKTALHFAETWERPKNIAVLLKAGAK